MDEGLDIDALLYGQLADINPNTEESIKQLLEELVGYVEESEMIPSFEGIGIDEVIPVGYDEYIGRHDIIPVGYDTEIGIDDIPFTYDLELPRDAVADIVSREVVDNIVSQIERRGKRYPEEAAYGPMLELPIEGDLSLLPRDDRSARKKQKLSRGPPTRISSRGRRPPQERYVNSDVSTSSANNIAEILGRKREGGKRRKYSKKR